MSNMPEPYVCEKCKKRINAEYALMMWNGKDYQLLSAYCDKHKSEFIKDLGIKESKEKK